MTHDELTTVRSANVVRLLGPLLLFLVLVSIAAAQPAGHTAAKNVLVIYDEQDKLPGLAILDQSLRSTLFSSPSFKIDIYTENLDLSRFTEEDYHGFLRDYLRDKYAGKKIDVIISVMGPALDFLLENAEPISPGTPIVFCGIDRREIDSKNIGPNITGVLVKREFAGTLDIALKLQPDTRKVIYIAGSSSFDKRLTEQAKAELADYAGRVEIEYLTDFELNGLLTRVSTLPPHTIILASTVFNDNTGKAFVPHDVVSLISQRANVPVYGFLDQFVGRGIVGGRLYSVEEHGHKAAQLALGILGGSSVSDLPMIEAEATQDIFDWRELQRWGLDVAKLPAGSVIRNRVATPWDEYKWYIAGALLVGLVQSGLILWLLFVQSRRRKAELERSELQAEVLTEHQKLEAVLANVSAIVWESRVRSGPGDRHVTFMSGFVEKILGYTSDEVTAIPNFWRTIAVDEDKQLVNDVLHSILTTGKGAVQQFRCRTKDGSLIWLGLYMDAIPEEDGKAGLRGVAIDVTERKEAEQAIEFLGGKLINAQEEERSRVARELHDDLGQSLALLSIQLELLRQDPGDADAVKRKVERIESRIHDLSSDIRRISHELHPAKLEQLGLESALRGFCREVAAAHKFEVEFEAVDVAGIQLRANVALALYRIAQESLQNVQRHSGASLASVRINADNGYVEMTVADNGRGFDPDSVSHKESLGLISMLERIRSVNGILAVESHPGDGTRIKVRVPAREKRS